MTIIVVNVMLLLLPTVSVIVLFDALRRICKALKTRPDLRLNEKNMTVHILTFSIFLINDYVAKVLLLFEKRPLAYQVSHFITIIFFCVSTLIFIGILLLFSMIKKERF